MELFDKAPPGGQGLPLERRVAAMEDYLAYLQEQGHYGFRQVGKRLNALDGGKDGKEHGK